MHSSPKFGGGARFNNYEDISNYFKGILGNCFRLRLQFLQFAPLEFPVRSFLLLYTIATVSRAFFEKEKDRIDAHSVRFDVGPFPFVLSPSPSRASQNRRDSFQISLHLLPSFLLLPIKRPFWSRWALFLIRPCYEKGEA